MQKEEYISIVKERIKDNDKAKKLLIDQINNYYLSKEKYKLMSHNYKVGDNVHLRKGTLLHGTYKNIDGLKEILKDGLISSWFIDGRMTKYPSSVGVWNLKQDYYLKDYIDYYSGGTLCLYGIDETNDNFTKVIPYNKMSDFLKEVNNKNYHMWKLEQTKEARFMPSLIQNKVQIGIIFNGESDDISNLLNGDILNVCVDDITVKEFVNPNYYEQFIKDRQNKDDFFTNRESAILFGIPSNFIEGILVGREYEKDNTKLEVIKNLLPNCYICNLDGKVIVE